MIQKEIFLIRHGETDFNRKGIVQGSGIDAPLNKTGLKQAEAFYNEYCNHFFDKIYISELQRTWQTVQAFANAGMHVEKHSGLNEICWGKYEGTRIADAPKPYFDDLTRSWQRGQTHLAIKGGESPEDVAKRQETILEQIFSRTEETKILICMHGRAMRILLCKLLNKSLQEMNNFHHNNTSLYHLIYNYSDNSIYATRQNCLAHLHLV